MFRGAIALIVIKKEIFMRIYILIILLLSIVVPFGIKSGIENASLALGGGCGGGACMIEDATSSPLQNRHMPNNLNDLKRIDAFQPKAQSHSPEPIVNMDVDREAESRKLGQDCQFGVCFPGPAQFQNSQTAPNPSK